MGRGIRKLWSSPNRGPVFDNGDWQSHSGNSWGPNSCEDGLLWEIPDFQVTQLDGWHLLRQETPGRRGWWKMITRMTVDVFLSEMSQRMPVRQHTCRSGAQREQHWDRNLKVFDTQSKLWAWIQWPGERGRERKEGDRPKPRELLLF